MIDRDKLTVGGFPKVHKRLDLVDFARYMRDQGVDDEDAEAVAQMLEGSYLKVWLNHNQAFREKHLEWNALVESGEVEDAWALGREVQADLWGCEVEDVNAIYDLEPSLARWINDKAWSFVGEYRSGRKKVDGS